MYVPFGLFAVCGFFLHTAVRLLVSSALLRNARRDQAAPSISFLARQRVMRHGTAYLVLHGMQLSAAMVFLLLADDIGQWLGLPAVWNLLLLVWCSRPIFSLVGWLVINDVLYLCLGVCSLTKWTCFQPAHEETATRAPAGHVRAKLPDRGAGPPVLQRARTVPVGGTTQGSAPGAGAQGQGWQLRAAQLQGIEEVGFKEELRFELLYDVAVGIGELAQWELREEQLARAHERRAAEPPWRASIDLGELSHTGSISGSISGSFAGGSTGAGSRELTRVQSHPCSPRPDSSQVPRRASFASPPLATCREHAAARPPLAEPLLSAGTMGGSGAPPSAPPSALAHTGRPDGWRSLRSPTSGDDNGNGNGRGQGHSNAQGDSRCGDSRCGDSWRPIEIVSPVACASSTSSPPRGLGAFQMKAASDRALRSLGLDDVESLPPLSRAESLGLSPLPPLRSPGPYMPPAGRPVSYSEGLSASAPIPRSASESHMNALRAALVDAAAPRSQAQHYEVERFRRLRSLFGVGAAAYARAFPDDLTTLGDTWRQRLKESVSEGKSGSFFYRVLPSSGTDAERPASCFIVKQISRREKQSLMALLPAYEEHVAQREGNSFIQYLGCHSMTLRWAFSGKVYFVVMANFVPVRPWLAFDLKGATANRRTLAARSLHRLAGADVDEVSGGGTPGAAGSAPSRRVKKQAAYGTLKDWEWMDIAMAVDVNESDRLHIAETIVGDSKFLASQGLLDYSLLVGIIRLPAHLNQAQSEARLEQLRAAGGYISLERQKAYFFGIIDVLEFYNLRWRMQRLVLVALYHLICKGADALGISALDPHDYAERFRTFMLYEVLGLPRPPAGGATGGGAGGGTGGAGQREPGAPGLGPAQEGRWLRPGSGSEAEAGRGLGAIYSTEELLRPSLAYAKWGTLWQRRRRGLVEERIEGLRSDYTRRIEFLESELSRLQAATGETHEGGGGEASGARAPTRVPTPAPTPTMAPMPTPLSTPSLTTATKLSVTAPRAAPVYPNTPSAELADFASPSFEAAERLVAEALRPGAPALAISSPAPVVFSTGEAPYSPAISLASPAPDATFATV